MRNPVVALLACAACAAAVTGARASLTPQPCLPGQLRATLAVKLTGSRVTGTATITDKGLRCGLRITAVGVDDASGWTTISRRPPTLVLEHGRRARTAISWRNWCGLRPAQLVLTLAPSKERFAFPYGPMPPCTNRTQKTQVELGRPTLLRR